MGMLQRIKILLELTKCRISLFASLSTSAGFILAKQGISREIFLPVFGVFLLACGSCALNQYQEREIDGRMERTRGRPLPSGRLDPWVALWVALGLICLGAFILFYGGGCEVGAPGLFAILWYNGVYTYLKRRTAFAAVPGALVGVIPPALGWLSGGGSFLDPRIWAISFFFFIWQVPHFWLLLLDSGGDYEKAGLPSLTSIFSTAQLKRILSVWILSTAVSCLFMPLFGFLKFSFSQLLLLGLTLWLVWDTTNFLRSSPKEASVRFTFVRVNIFVLSVVSLLSLDSLLKSAW